MALRKVSLQDKYISSVDHIFLNGTQSIVRLLIEQKEADRKAGLNTAAFVSGYRGSPLAGVDMALWSAKKYLKEYDIHFIPGVNEELGVTAVWGTQQLHLFDNPKFDGVFGLWYGKGPGVDRALDAIKHANFAGSSPNGGALLVAGDDHICESSTLPHQSEFDLVAAAVPVLNPSTIEEFIQFGLYGYALSRYSGCWVGLIALTEVVNSSRSISPKFDMVDMSLLPKQGNLHTRWPDKPNDQEYRHFEEKLKAVSVFAGLGLTDKIINRPKDMRYAIISTGKAHLDLMQAMQILGLTLKDFDRLGIGIYKIGLTWPLYREGILAFCQGTQKILCVEEKRSLIETQIKEILYHIPNRPLIIGKKDTAFQDLLPEIGEIHPHHLAHILVKEFGLQHGNFMEEEKLPHVQTPAMRRTPYYCSGCPHNSSTKIPEGHVGLGGIGCHIMAAWLMPERRTQTVTQMGGEGVTWIGTSKFSGVEHVFVNIGDGTYYHSGIMAIRAAVAANINITYKVLYNDAVAMTGGQAVDGPLSVVDVARQLWAERVNKIVIVSDDIAKYKKHKQEFPKGISFYQRRDLEHVQLSLASAKGVTAIIYEQTCAAEKRRRRKRNLMVDPPQRIFINSAVCEGCGDCSKTSNCVSVTPLATELGVKRKIDQSSCNKDYSCSDGFCPSFVAVKSGVLRKQKRDNHIDWSPLQDPNLPQLDTPYGILVAGVGGTGVITVGAILAMAAHIEGKGCSTLDMTGLAQKGGSVLTHVKIGKTPDDIYAVRLTLGETNLLLGCDIMVAASEDVLSTCTDKHTFALLNTEETITGAFTQNPDFHIPTAALVKNIEAHSHINEKIPATKLAGYLFGESITANFFMIGYAFQKGYIPLRAASIEAAIALNNVSIEENTQAFHYGRMAADNYTAFMEKIGYKPHHFKALDSLDEVLNHRKALLTAYQDANYANWFEAFILNIKEEETNKGLNKQHAFSGSVAKYLAKLMAYKDEYEVARLYSSPQFQQELEHTFEGKQNLRIFLAPPMFAKRDKTTGHLVKREYGAWVLSLFRLLKHGKLLRGSVLDVFGKTIERKCERALYRLYREKMYLVSLGLCEENYHLGLALATLPEHIRGFGHVKQAHIKQVFAKEIDLWHAFWEKSPMHQPELPQHKHVTAYLEA